MLLLVAHEKNNSHKFTRHDRRARRLETGIGRGIKDAI